MPDKLSIINEIGDLGGRFDELSDQDDAKIREQMNSKESKDK